MRGRERSVVHLGCVCPAVHGHFRRLVCSGWGGHGYGGSWVMAVMWLGRGAGWRAVVVVVVVVVVCGRGVERGGGRSMIRRPRCPVRGE